MKKDQKGLQTCTIAMIKTTVATVKNKNSSATSTCEIDDVVIKKCMIGSNTAGKTINMYIHRNAIHIELVDLFTFLAHDNSLLILVECSTTDAG